ncbi:MAG TPA: C39 family peptidase [Dictyobacter sp.]|nr:C39 family peptidase [Dictyobacter sp.]
MKSFRSLDANVMSIPRVIFSCLLSLVCLSFFSAQAAHAASSASTPEQYDELWQQNSYHDFSTWTGNGVGILYGSEFHLVPTARATCNATDIDGGVAHYAAAAHLCAGQDPYAAGQYNSGSNYYNGGSFYFGTIVSPIHHTAKPVTTIIASWDATTPTGTWMEVHVRVLEGGTWTHWYDLPIWASDLSTIQRHSVDGQSDTTGSVATDTFYTGSQPATAYQLGLTLFSTSTSASPSVRSINAIASYDSDPQHTPQIASDISVWGKNLNVPQRSQMLSEYQGLGYGGGGEVWCSPTSTSMVMAYWANVLHRPQLNQTVPDAAQGTYDFTYEGTGNWPFNTAYAASYGLRAYVTRMYSMSQIEQWVKRGVPIVISIAYQQGELPGTPIPGSDGHLIVVRGFATNGDVITNDPAAASDSGVEITYNRAALQNVWLKYSNGTAYVIYPENWPTPPVADQ